MHLYLREDWLHISSVRKCSATSCRLCFCRFVTYLSLSNAEAAHRHKHRTISFSRSLAGTVHRAHSPNLVLLIHLAAAHKPSSAELNLILWTSGTLMFPSCCCCCATLACAIAQVDRLDISISKPRDFYLYLQWPTFRAVSAVLGGRNVSLVIICIVLLLLLRVREEYLLQMAFDHFRMLQLVKAATGTCWCLSSTFGRIRPLVSSFVLRLSTQPIPNHQATQPPS